MQRIGQWGICALMVALGWQTSALAADTLFVHW
jgi:hypothetical protein